MILIVKQYICSECNKDFFVYLKNDARLCPYCKSNSIELQTMSDTDEVYCHTLIDDPDKKIFNNLTSENR